MIETTEFADALTVRCPPGDNLMLHAAIHRAPGGLVIVVESGDLDRARAKPAKEAAETLDAWEAAHRARIDGILAAAGCEG